MNKEEYIIYTDASWDLRLPSVSFGAFIVYLNGNKIYEEGKKQKGKINDNREFKNLNRAVIEVHKKFYNGNKNQIFIFRNDCNPLISKFNKMLYKINNKIPIDYKIIKDTDRLKTATIKLYKNRNLVFEWIPREQNHEADNLAKKYFDNYLMNQGLNNIEKFMKTDLEYTIKKWEELFKDEKSSKNINKLKTFIKNEFEE